MTRAKLEQAKRYAGNRPDGHGLILCNSYAEVLTLKKFLGEQQELFIISASRTAELERINAIEVSSFLNLCRIGGSYTACLLRLRQRRAITWKKLFPQYGYKPGDWINYRGETRIITDFFYHSWNDPCFSAVCNDGSLVPLEGVQIHPDARITAIARKQKRTKFL